MQSSNLLGARRGWIAAFAAVVFAATLGACGGGGGGGNSPPPAAIAAPTVATQPQSQVVADGQPASFTIGVVSATTPSYQWSRGGVAIPGATAATYTIPAVQLGDDGATFIVAATNGGGTVQSASATLNVTPVAPGIANNAPTTVAVIEGQPATFAVTATGSQPLSFQWRRGGVAIAGATSATYTIPATVASDNGATFDVVVTNVAGTVTSAVFTLTVTVQVQAPSIATQPQAASVRSGDPATFSVTAAGTAPFTYQWLRDGTAIAGAQSASYTLTSTALNDSGASFSVTVGNAAGSVQSAAAVLTVTPQPGLAVLAGNIGGPGTIDGSGMAARFAAPSSVAIDNAGNVYVADGATVRKLGVGGVVTTLAGSPTQRGTRDGSGGTALFGTAAGVAVDAAANVYVADSTNHTIRKITPTGAVTTVAGTGTAGAVDGAALSASFNAPTGIAVDRTGALYVADTGNHTIRRIDPSGVVTTLAGSPGVAGAANGFGATASFNAPAAVAVDASLVVYVADLGNATVRVVTPAGSVTTLAGTAGARGATDGVGSAARFNFPFGIAVDGTGNIYVGDGGSGTIRRIASGGAVTTVAGTATVLGGADGTGAAASFSAVVGVASDAAGALTIADRDNFEIRSVTPTGVVATVAGLLRISGGNDGAQGAATFALPDGIAIDRAGTVYVSDPGNGTIRRVTPAGAASTLAGTAGLFGSADGVGPAARFGSVRGIAVNASGIVYAADFINNAIRAISPAGTVTTLAGTPSGSGSADGTGSAATFGGPSAIAFDAAGNLFVTDTLNGTIRKVTAAGVVTTFAGTAGRFGAADGVGGAASFNLPTGIALDAAGNLVVTDTGNATIRRITPAGVVTTIAGVAGRTGSTDGVGAAALFNAPIGIVGDGAGNLYVADTANSTIRKIDASGAVTTVVGTANGLRGVRLGAFPGSLSQPLFLGISPTGTLYCSDANGILAITFP